MFNVKTQVWITAYKVCLKRKANGAIKFFINNWNKNQHHLLQSSFLGKPHTAGNVVPTPGSIAGSLYVEVPSGGLSRPFGWCPYFQNDNFWGGIWVLGKRRNHTDSDQASMELRNHWNTLFRQYFIHGDGNVTASVVVIQHLSVRMTNS
jgi:hypothetical protein